MRPTGRLHLGHLVGALDNWLKLQEQYECFFMVADWHALMSEYENSPLVGEYTLDNVIDWLSVGLDPEKATFFIQSQVKEHLELHMIFSCITPLGLLERCPTYKEQMREIKTRNLNTYGFLGYPVLQAADILVYKADKVPVGEDQLPHLELTREIARRFNALCKKDLLPSPEAILTKTPRLLGTDGRKMSKSYGNTVDISDSEETIKKKIGSMFTDPKRIKLTDPGHPDSCNVHAYYAVFAPQMKPQVDDWCRNAKVGCTQCKAMLAEEIIKILKPVHQKRKEFSKDKAKVARILEKGKEKASEAGSRTIKEIRHALGI